MRSRLAFLNACGTAEEDSQRLATHMVCQPGPWHTARVWRRARAVMCALSLVASSGQIIEDAPMLKPWPSPGTRCAWTLCPARQHGRGPVLRFTPAAWRRFAEQVKGARKLGTDFAARPADIKSRGALSRPGAPPALSMWYCLGAVLRESDAGWPQPAGEGLADHPQRLRFGHAGVLAVNVELVNPAGHIRRPDRRS
jgi:hypothetical protein